MHSIHPTPTPVNGLPLDGPRPDPQGGYVVLVNGIEMAWSDTPDQAERSYHELVREPILWTVNGQTRLLQVAL